MLWVVAAVVVCPCTLLRLVEGKLAYAMPGKALCAALD